MRGHHITIADENGFIIDSSINPQRLGRLNLRGLGIFDVMRAKDAAHVLSLAATAMHTGDVYTCSVALLDVPIIMSIRYLRKEKQFLINSAFNDKKRTEFTRRVLLMMSKTG